MAFEQPARFRITAAERRAARHDPGDRDHEPAQRGEGDGPRRVELSERGRNPSGGVEQQPAEHTARDARDERGQHDGDREQVGKVAPAWIVPKYV